MGCNSRRWLCIAPDCQPGTAHDITPKLVEVFSVPNVDERIRELCGLLSNEQNPEKLIELAAELNRLLEVKEQRLLSRQKLANSKSAD
jgi:hypothetical protein